MSSNAKLLKVILIYLTIMCITVFFFNWIGPYKGELAPFGYFSFTGLCVVILVMNRHMKNRLLLTAIFHLFYSIIFLKDW